MEKLLNLLIFVPPILWSLSFVCYMSFKNHKVANRFFLNGVIVFCLHLVLNLVFLQFSGFKLSSFYFLALFGSIFTLVGQHKANIKPLPIFVLPILIIFSLLMFKFQNPYLTSNFNALLSSHIVLAILGQLCAIGAFFCSLLYYIQHYRLKQKNISGLIKNVPSLNRLAQINYQLALVGFGLLSLGLITGFIYVQINDVDSSLLLNKIFWAVSVWVWYFIIILSKNIFKLNYRHIAMLSLGGFGILIIGFFGMDISEVFKSH